MTVAERDALKFLGIAIPVALAGLLLIDPFSLVSVLALPAVAAVALLAFGALRGNRMAILALVFIAVFLIQAVFRVREYQDKDLDLQVLLKIVVWLLAAAVAVVYARSWIAIVIKPVNVPWMLLIAWLLVTAIVSPVMAYSALSAFTIGACIVFCAYLFATFEHVEVFATVVAAIVLFCVISIVVYFAVPEFGHFVYFVDGERYVSPRLAGIAGSANNMGRMAAFALVLIGLYAREFHRMNRWFVPVGVLITGVSLIMTNSRTSMFMTAAILLATYVLRWKRLYAAVFLVSLGLVALALALPAGDETLRLISRSGNIDEVTSLTRRTDIWYAVLQIAQAKPWTGHGYASSIFVLPQYESDIGFIASHAHNLMLQLLLTTGWIGVALFTVSVIVIALRGVIAGDRVVLAMLTFVLFNGITESSGFTTIPNICTLAFAIAVTLPPLRSENEYYHSYQRRFPRPA